MALSPEEIQAARKQYGIGASSATGSAALSAPVDHASRMARLNDVVNTQKNASRGFLGTLGAIAGDVKDAAIKRGGAALSELQTPEPSLKEKLNPANLLGPLAAPAAGGDSRALRILGQGAGFVGDVLGSTIGEGFATAEAKSPTLKAEADKTKALIGQGFGAVHGPEVISAYEDWKTKHPDAAKNLEAYGNIAALLPIGKGAQLAERGAEAATKVGVEGLESAAKGIASATEKVGGLKGGVINTLEHAATPVAENVKTVLTSPTRSADIAEKITEHFTNAKTALKNTSAKTPLELSGEKQLGGAMADLQKKLTEAGKAKETALAERSVAKVPVKEAYDSLGKKLASRLGTAIDSEGNIVNAIGRESVILGNAADEKLVKMAHDAIGTLKKNPTLQQVNDIVDKLQDQLYKAKQLGAIPLNTKTESVIKGFVSDLNKAATEVGGEAYKAANAEYARVVELRNILNKSLGPKMARAGSVMKQLFSTSGKAAKDLVAALEKETGRNIFEDATLAKYAMESIGDPRVRSLLENVPTSKSGVTKMIMDYVLEKLKNPEGVAKRILESAPPVIPK